MTVKIDLENYYGHLHIMEQGGKYYWGIMDHDRLVMKEIPKWLYDSIVEYTKLEGCYKDEITLPHSYS